jgi:hypothetical protein
MTKLVYPAEGLKRIIKANMENVSANLNQVVNRLNLRVPDDFGFYKYLTTEFPDAIKKYKKEADRINEIAGRVDNTYNTLDSDMKNAAKTLSTGPIKERERTVII